MKIACVLINDRFYNQFLKIKKYYKFIYAIEIRVDTFYPDLQKIASIATILKKKFPDIQLILTFRKFEEGGKIKISEEKRKETILNFLKTFKNLFNFVDIEFKSPIKYEIYEFLKKNKKNIIFSIHFLKKYKENTLYKELLQIKNYIKDKRIKNYIVKVVAKISDFSEYFKTLKKTYKILKDINYTFFTTGKTSTISRCISVILEMPLVYAALTKPVIKTQPDISELLSSLKKLGLENKN
ncbi:MAG: type I 3-dehydroquinate dehydratase [Endomicrobiia bacterium]